MLRYMENLVGRKVKVVNGFVGVTIGKEYEIVSVEDDLFMIIEDNGKEQGYCISHINNGNLKLVPEEYQPNQGEKVFAGQNENECIETVYVATFNGWHYTTSGTFRHIEPLKEEIKVGDWVFRKTDNIAVFKYDYKFIEHLDELIKITDEELIKKLNEL